MKTKQDIQKEALDIILKYDRTTVCMSIGTGKTLLGLQYMDTLYHNMVEFLVVAPKVSIFQSWLDDAKKFNLEHLIPHIKFSTYLSLGKQDLDFNLIILDEAHSLIIDGAHSEYLDQFKGKILGLTGTPPRHGSDRANMISKYCPIRYEYTTDEAVNDQVLNDYRIIVHSLSLDKSNTIKKKTKSGGFWMTSEQKEYDYWNTRILNAKSDKDKMMARILRMKSIMSFPGKEIYTKKLLNSINEKVIIFANDIAQCERLAKDTYHSKNKLSEENLTNFKEGIITKLGAVQQLSEGINITGLAACIILHSFSGDSPKASQKLGRCLRLNIDQVADIHILKYIGTIDEVWVQGVLDKYDPNKIFYK